MNQKLLKINDIPVITLQDNSKNYVYLLFRINYGQFFEEHLESAHIIEHWVLEGTKKYPSRSKLNDAVDSLGAQMNGFSGIHETGYWIKVPKENLSFAFDILKEIVTKPLFEGSKLQNVMSAILIEISGRANSTRRNIILGRHRAIFCKTTRAHHPEYEERVKSVKNIERSEMIKIFEQHYVKQNLSIGIAGNFSLEEIGKEVESIKIKDGKKSNWKVKLDLKDITQKRKIKQERTVVIVALPKETYSENLILSTILGEKRNSRLSKRLRNEEKLVYTASSRIERYDKDIFLVIGANFCKGDGEKVEEVIHDELYQLIHEQRITKKEFEDAKIHASGRISLNDDYPKIIRRELLDFETFGKLLTPKDILKGIKDVDFERFKTFLGKINLKEYATCRVVTK
jgi:zinc protease